MTFNSFVMGPLLWFVSIGFILSILIKLTLSIYEILNKSRKKKDGWLGKLLLIGSLLLPFHRAIAKKTIYGAIRYLFHICVIAVPIWFSGHVILWEESRFDWSFSSFSDAWADWMTILVIGFSAYFLIRRLVLPDIRHNSSKADYLLILLTALPFITGYLEAHNSLYFIPFLAERMQIFHVLSGEAFLIMVVFLFCRTQLNKKSCTGCAACEICCPTDTLLYRDESGTRTFTYLSSQCIVCGACVEACPEEAAELRHNLSLKAFFQMASRQPITSIPLKICETCGTFFSPEPQLRKIDHKLTEIGHQSADYIHLCTKCRMFNNAEKVQKTAGKVRFITR